MFEDTIDEIDGHLMAAAPNAYFNPRTNEYHIALDSVGQAYMYFAVHESVHDIAVNSRLGYERLEELVLDTFRARGEDIDALVAIQKEVHPGQDEAYWREEVLANTVPVILTDKQTGIEFARRFTNASEDTRNAFEKILDAIRAFLQKAYDVLRQEKSWRQMEAVKKDIDALAAIREAYFDALEDIAGTESGEGEARFSIKEFEDGSKYVEVDTDQDAFDGLSLAGMQRKARRIIMDKFAGKVISDSHRAYVNAKGAKEFAFPAKFIKDDTAKEAKMRTSPELDNLLDASVFLRHEDDDGRHPDAIGGWDKYSTTFKVGKEYFKGEIQIKIIKRGRLFYDVTKIKNITSGINSQSATSADAASGSNTSDRNVSQKDTPVNTSIRKT